MAFLTLKTSPVYEPGSPALRVEGVRVGKDGRVALGGGCAVYYRLAPADEVVYTAEAASGAW